jgi:hypothetical protein
MSNGRGEQMKMTAGLDLGDKYSYLCLIDTESGEVIEENRLRTTPEDIRRRFEPEQQLHVAIEVGTHSPWVSRILEERGHEVLVFRRPARYGSSTQTSARPTSWMPRSWGTPCPSRSGAFVPGGASERGLPSSPGLGQA